jgi:uncharacterized protein
MSKLIKILSIDGGGIRGIIPAMLLAEIEKRTNKRIVELFDLIAGTSTGGILALGLNKPCPDPNSQGKPEFTAERLIDLYEQEGSKIFPLWLHKGMWTNIGRLFHAKYPLKNFEQILHTYFNEARLSESLKNVLITSYDIEYRRPHIFLSREAKNDPNLDFLMKKVARATAAAPTYFEPLKLERSDSVRDYYALVDGGVFANNPTLYAYTEAKRIYKDTNDFLVVSLGTGELAPRMPYEEARKWGWASWARPILNVVFDGISDAVHSQLQYLIPEDRYYRFQTELGVLGDEMDNAHPDNIKELKILADKMIFKEQKLLDEVCQLLL